MVVLGKVLLLTNCVLSAFCISSSNHADKFVDPFDMSGTFNQFSCSSSSQCDAPKVGWNVDSKAIIDYNQGKTVNNDHTKQCDMYLKRFVNLFLRATGLKELKIVADETGLEIVRLEFLLSKNDLLILQSYGKQGESGVKIETVSDVLSNIFSKNVFKYSKDNNYGKDTLFKWTKGIYFKLISSPEWTIFSCIVLIMLMMFWCVYKTQSYRLALFTILLLIFIGGFGFTWMRMYEEEEVKRYYDKIKHGDAPYHCKGNQMRWYEQFYYGLFGEDCIEFYQRRDVRPLVKVSPAAAFMETFSSMVIIPVSNVGKAYGTFIGSVINAVPYWLKPLALPFAIIIPPVFTFLVIALLFNYRMSFSLTGINVIPVWFSTPAVNTGAQQENYIDDISNRNDNQNRITTSDPLNSESKSPYVLLNWATFEKVVANITGGKVENSNDNDALQSDGRSEMVLSSTQDKTIPHSDVNGEEKCNERSEAYSSFKQRSSFSVPTENETVEIDQDSKDLGFGDHNECTLLNKSKHV